MHGPCAGGRQRGRKSPACLIIPPRPPPPPGTRPSPYPAPSPPVPPFPSLPHTHTAEHRLQGSRQHGVVDERVRGIVVDVHQEEALVWPCHVQQAQRHVPERHPVRQQHLRTSSGAPHHELGLHITPRAALAPGTAAHLLPPWTTIPSPIAAGLHCLAPLSPPHVPLTA